MKRWGPIVGWIALGFVLGAGVVFMRTIQLLARGVLVNKAAS